jgi:uncharacterized protein (DUF433 family)
MACRKQGKMAVAVFPITVDSNGVAYVEGTSTKVIEVVQAKQAQELTPEQVQSELPHLTLAQVYAALAYYHANRDELDGQIRERRNFADELRAQEPNPLTRAELIARRTPRA